MLFNIAVKMDSDSAGCVCDFFLTATVLGDKEK